MSALQAIGWTAPGLVVVLSDYLGFRWLMRHTDKLQKLSERVAWLEAKVDGHEDPREGGGL